MPYVMLKVFSPSGLSVIFVWYDDLLWPDGPMLFRTQDEASAYITRVNAAIGYKG